MPTVHDPTGREWVIEEIGLTANTAIRRPDDPMLALTHLTLRVSSGEESFVVSTGREGRALSNADLWARLACARELKERRR